MFEEINTQPLTYIKGSFLERVAPVERIVFACSEREYDITKEYNWEHHQVETQDK